MSKILKVLLNYIGGEEQVCYDDDLVYELSNIDVISTTIGKNLTGIWNEVKLYSIKGDFVLELRRINCKVCGGIGICKCKCPICNGCFEEYISENCFICHHCIDESDGLDSRLTITEVNFENYKIELSNYISFLHKFMSKCPTYKTYNKLSQTELNEFDEGSKF